MELSQSEKTVQIYEEINKVTPYSLKNKLLYIQRLNQERTQYQEETYEAEYLEVKRKYDLEFEKCYQEISSYVKGTARPTLTPEDMKKYNIKAADAADSENGIPEYWFNVLSNAKKFISLNKNDEKILKSLTDVKVSLKDDKLSYAIEFYFAPNEYFTNEVLYKTYFYDIKDHQLHKVEKSGVMWRSQDKIPNKMIKTKTVKKGKNTQTKVIESEVESFFDMFVVTKGEEKNTEEDNYMDQEEGEFFKDDLIPFSLEYYLNIVTSELYEGEDEDDMDD